MARVSDKDIVDRFGRIPIRQWSRREGSPEIGPSFQASDGTFTYELRESNGQGIAMDVEDAHGRLIRTYCGPETRQKYEQLVQRNQGPSL